MSRWLSFRFWREASSVMVAGALGIVTNLITEDYTTALALAVGALLLIQIILRTLEIRSEERHALAEARTAREKKLGALRSESNAPALELLTARFSPTPPWGRRAQRNQLMGWCVDSIGGARILAGPAGSGKSRLALAVAESLPAGWIAGWALSLDGLVQDVVACPEKALIIVDDADLRDGVEVLLAEAAEHSDQVRVLLLARDGGALQTALLPKPPMTVRAMLAAPPLVLGSAGQPEDYKRWFVEAVALYARQLNLRTPASLALPSLIGDQNCSMLELHARALLVALEHGGKSETTLLGVVQHLLKIEQGRWMASITAKFPVNVGLELITEVVAVLAMIPAPTLSDAANTLQLIPDLDGDAAKPLRYSYARWARACYPPSGDFRIGLRPHLVAEHLIVKYVRTYPDFLDNKRPNFIMQAKAALMMLARACSNFPEALDLFCHIVRENPCILTEAIVVTLGSGATGAHVDIFLAECVSAAGPATVPESGTLPGIERLARTACAVAEAAAWRARESGTSSDRLNALLELSSRQNALGRHGNAAKTARQAVTLAQKMAMSDTSNRERHARSLRQLSGVLIKLNRHNEAADSGQKAVDLYRLLAQEDHLHLPSLGGALSNLGLQLLNIGDYDSGVGAGEEAVAIYRTLTCDDVDHSVELGGALINLGSMLAELRRYREAAPVIEEAVAVYRIAVQSDHGVSEKLGRAISNLSATMVELRRYREAIDAGEEAVSLFRNLTESNPGFRSDLGHAAGNLSFAMYTGGRYLDAIRYAEEAVAIFRRLTQENTAYRGALARALMNLGSQLSKLRRLQEAVSVAEEAVAVYRLAVQDDPSQPGYLARALSNLSGHFIEAGRNSEAIGSAQEAIAIYRMVKNKRGIQEPLAFTLTNLGAALAAMGRTRDAYSAYRQAVILRRDLATRDPELYGTTYRRARDFLRKFLEQNGEFEAAASFDLDRPNPTTT